MDLNQTTTISRRKTFTVPVPLGVRVLEVSSTNQTFTAGEPGDHTINISKQSSSKALISNKADIANTEDMPLLSLKSILGDNGQLWNCTDPDSFLQDEDIHGHFGFLVNYRNSRFPSFEVKKGPNVPGAKEDQPDAALDMELECLRQQERHLKGNFYCVNFVKSRSKVVFESYIN